jgi:hypothetical protein
MEPRHSFRYPEDQWRRVKARAAAEGTTATEIIAAHLDEYVDGRNIHIAPKYVRGERNIIVEAPAVVPSCRAVIGEDKTPCGCGGFQPQTKSPLRCEDCGHVEGVHT